MNWTTIQTILKTANKVPDRRLEKSDEEWKALLTDEQYRIARKRGTELPGTSNLCFIHEPGMYACVCCGTQLFDSSDKFDSGTGWPSFSEPMKDNVISYYEDYTHGMSRVEVTCSTCDAHLGHVFPDGPEPTGLRFCINGVVLRKTS